MIPSVRSQIVYQQSRQKENHDYHAIEREFVVGDLVLAKNFTDVSPTPGESPLKDLHVSYEVKLELFIDT